MSIPVIIAVSFDVDEPDQVVEPLHALDVPNLPRFAGKVRIVVGDDVADVVEFLDGPEVD